VREEREVLDDLVLHLPQHLNAVVLTLLYVVGVVHDHLHQTRQGNLLHVSQQHRLNDLEEGLLAHALRLRHHTFNDFGLDLRREVVHTHEVEDPEETLVLVLLDLDHLGQDLILNIDQNRVPDLPFLDLHDGLEQTVEFGQVHGHLVNLTDEDLLVLLAVAVDAPANEKLQEL
jgi:hypothetical protein